MKNIWQFVEQHRPVSFTVSTTLKNTPNTTLSQERKKMSPNITSDTSETKTQEKNAQTCCKQFYVGTISL